MDNIEKLEEALIRLRKLNREMWETYGSELCASDMLSKEQEIEDLIKSLRETT